MECKRLIAAAVLGLLSGAQRVKADTLYDAQHRALRKGHGTVSTSKISWKDCDSDKEQTFPSPPYSVEPGNDCTPPIVEKHSCKGTNACKSKGGCATGDNGCKGKNSCKAKGGCATT